MKKSHKIIINIARGGSKDTCINAGVNIFKRDNVEIKLIHIKNP